MDTGKIINVNDRLCDLIGYSRDEIVGQLLTEVGFVSRNDMDRLLHSLKESGEVQAEEIGVEAKNGTILDTLLFARSIRFSRQSFILSIFLDLTERNRLEQQFIHAQKMEAIGTLAGGIAHDFNNLLMGMQGNASLLLLDMPGDHPHHDKIKNIEVHIKRGAELTRQLLGFARGGKYEIQPIDINELVRTSAHMFGRTRKEITIREDYQKDPWGVEVDSGQIDQVLLNIFINAWQAMPNGGDLVLTTQNVLLHERDSGPLGMEPGRHIKISVKDTGLGMDAETQKRIFEPFFTTRPRGRGTGLGLASAYGIVKNHGGSIHVESSPGNGTRFDIYLPASDKKTLTDQPTSQEITKGSETVLLVDDEDMIVEVGQGLLERLGYRALTAKTGKDAIATYKKNLDQIDMVILDMVMPDMGGGETFDRLREVNPNVKVLLSSGYTVEGEAAEILKRGCDGFIQKPFDVQQLSQKLHELLDKGH
jgi:PAS domain S-box-containing protein